MTEATAAPEQPKRKKGPSKAETALLPPFATLGLAQILVPATADGFAAASAEILAAGVAGFDTESKPTFRVGEVSDGPHVFQFAIAGKAFLFQSCHAGSHEVLRHLLGSQTLLKVGFGLKSDRSQTRTKLGVAPAALLDLDSLFRQDGYSGDMGVRAAIGLVLGQRFHKSHKITTSNWALRELSAPQKLYAANDAWAALSVYQALRETRPALFGSGD